MAAGQRYLTAMARLQLPPAAAANRQDVVNDFSALAQTAPEGYATLGRLREAALKADSSDLQGAAALWDQVAADQR